jgi:UTP--glucose-1-phosphate uridylyltransferase
MLKEVFQRIIHFKGTLIQYDGNVRLLEFAQVPKDHVEEFKSIKKFKIFNTNNIWVNMESIAKNIEKFETLDLIVNKKDVGLQKVIQLETACGSAIKLFDKGIGIKVSRSRFLPVKNNSDLMLVQSNLYALQHGRLVFNHLRVEKMGEESSPLIKLGDEFKTVADFNERMPEIPDILELDHLTVSGNVFFGKKIVLKGNVIIVTTERIDIPDGSILENKVITGGMRIHDH